MKFWLSFTASVLVSAVLLSLMPVHGEAAIYRDVLRLHVLAETDSEEDQALKLKVRDAVLAETDRLLAECSSVEDAEKIVQVHSDEILAAAEACVRENGGDCAVSLTLGEEVYPRRDYGEVVFPAGRYRSLRVILGEGEGRNWWCVLYPGLCVRPAQAGEGEALAVGLTPEEYRIVTGAGENAQIRVRFRILELLSTLVRGEE